MRCLFIFWKIDQLLQNGFDNFCATYEKAYFSVKECMEEEMAEKEGNFEGSGKGKKAKVEVPDILEDGGEPAAAGAASAANGKEKADATENGVRL